MCVSVCIFKEQEKAEKVSKRESTLKEVESSTKDLRELLERHAITGTILELSDDAMVCEKNIQKIIQLWFLSDFLFPPAGYKQYNNNDNNFNLYSAYQETQGHFIWKQNKTKK